MNAPAVESATLVAPRPLLLTSGTGCDAERGTKLGQAGYSYAFVARQFTRLLETEFDLRPVGGAIPDAGPSDQPIAAHLSFRPLHEVELLPGVKNVVVPAWEFPSIPRAPWVTDPRQDWARQANRCDLLLQLCEFTRESFARCGVTTPMSVVPVPVAPGYFETPDWRPDQTITLETPALVVGRDAGGWPGGGDAPRSPGKNGAAPASSGRCGSLLRRLYYHPRVHRHVPPWLERGLKAGVREARRQRQLARWSRVELVDQVRLSGVVFTSVFNPLDRRKNWEDLLSAWYLTLAGRDDATLVLKLVGDDPAGIDEVLARCESFDQGGTGRVILLTGFLSDQQMFDLARATTWYVTPTRAEGACLPLMQWLAAGRPAVATCHTAIQDYFSPNEGLVVESHPEPCPWPHEPSQIFRTTWQRTVWSSLAEQLNRSCQMAIGDLPRYQALSQGAREMSWRRHHPDVVGPLLRGALWKLITGQDSPGQSFPGELSPGPLSPAQLLPGQLLPGQLLPGPGLPRQTSPQLTRVA